MGMPCDLAAILSVARAYGLPVIEDAACAIGSEIHFDGTWTRIGRVHGDVVCFSFHPRKVLTVGDGGMLTTHNPAWDARFRLWRQHGMSIPDTLRHGSPTVIFEAYSVQGFNYRMTDVQAAIGREQLKRITGIVARRRALAARYRAMLEAIEGVSPPSEPDWARSNWQSYCVRLDSAMDQLGVMQHLLDQGVASRRGIMCIHLEAAHADVPQRHPLPRSESARNHCILLPMFPQMTDEMQARVVAVLSDALAMQRPVRRVRRA
jgi:dTDP-4-amino-4,6-dideoxygalactose transaminase